MKNTKSITKLTKGDLLYYLEEMMVLDESDAFEEEMYDLLSQNKKITASDKAKLVKRMSHFHINKF